MKFRTIPILLALLLVAPAAEAARPKATASKAAKTAPTPKAAPEPPVTVEGLLSQAHDAVTRGDTDLAVRLAQAAIVQDPARTSSYVALGDVYAAAGQAEYARSFYDAALGIDPADTAAQKALADLKRNHPETTARAQP